MSGLVRHPKTSVYIHRRSIPERLRVSLGRREVKKSLGTKERNIATLRNHQVGAFITELLNDAGSSKQPEAYTELLDQFLRIPILDWDYASFVKRLRRQSGKECITEDDLHRWVDRWFESVITGGQVEVEYVNHLPGILVGPLTLRQAERLINDYCKATGLAERFSKDDSVLKQFREACLSHLQEHSPDQSTQYLTDGRKVSVHTDAVDHQGNPILVSEALSLYLADAQVRPGTERDWRTAVNRLIEFLGRDSLITSISPTQIVGFRDAIATYPKAVPKELKTASFLERCEYGKATDIRQISARTVNKNLNAIGAVFGWLTRNRYLVENPVQGIKAMVRESTETERLPFTTEDIILIFGKAYPEPSTAADYWLPFLALYTGCRIEELAKLRVEDVQGIDDIPFFHIHGRIKNKASLRRVPLNRNLVQLHFLEHIRGRSHPKALLFDGLHQNKLGKFSGAYSKRFNRYLRKIGINDERKVFHSFRHMFKDRCRESDVPAQVQDALLGHTSGSVGEGYGKGFSTKKLSDWVNRIDFKDLDSIGKRSS